MTVPKTIGDCDRELGEYRKALPRLTRDGRLAVWEQIDRVLEIRFLISQTGREKGAQGHQYDSEGREAT